MKAKYIKRTGVPGDYKYWYMDPKTHKLKEGFKTSPYKKEKKTEDPLPVQKKEKYNGFEGKLNNVSGHGNSGNFIIKKDGTFKFDVDGIGVKEGKLSDITNEEIKDYFEITDNSFKTLKKELDKARENLK